MKIKNKILAILLVAIFIISATGVSVAENLTQDNITIGVDENEIVNNTVELNKTDNTLLSQDDTYSSGDIVSEKQVDIKNKLGAGKSKVTVIFHKMSSEGEVTSSITNEISSTWGIGMAKFNNQVANKKYSDFVYDNEHWVFSHWEDANGNKITGTQTIVATGEDFEVHYYAKYTHTPLGTLRVKYNDNFGHGSSSMNYTDHNTAYKHTFKVPADYPQDKISFKYWEREDTGETFNDGDSLTVKPSEFDGKELNITVNAIYDVKTVVILDEVTDYTGNVVNITAKVEDAFGNPLNGGNAKLTIGTETHTADVKDGQAEFKDIALGEPGNYTYKVEYTGYDDYNPSEGINAYLPSEGELKVNVLPLNTTTVSDDVSGTVGEKVDITANITDQNEGFVQNGTAILKINGKEYTAEVDNGTAVFTGIELPLESTEATIEYQGNNYYNPSNTTIKVTVIAPDEPDDNQTDNQTITPIIDNDNQTDDTDDTKTTDENNTEVSIVDNTPTIDNNTTSNSSSDDNKTTIPLLNTGSEWGWLAVAIIMISCVLAIRRL